MKAKTKIIKAILWSKLKRQPYKLNFAITSACNSRCKTCNVGVNFQKDPTITKNDLSLSEIETILKQMPKSFSWISFSGGEPFLRKDLPEICRFALKYLPNLALISIPSNGLLTEEITRQTERIIKLNPPNLFLNFSLDGPEEVHDQIRGLKGAFRKTWNTYNKILTFSKQHKNLSVNLEVTISKYNLDYLASFLEKLIQDKHKITVTIAHQGHLYKNTKARVDFTQLNHNHQKLSKIIKIVNRNLNLTTPNDLIENRYLSEIENFYAHPKRQPLPCIALESSLAIDAQGNLHPCFMWEKTLGNIRNEKYNLETFLNNRKQIIRETQKVINSSRCPNCWTPCEAYQSIINSFFSLQIFKRLAHLRV